MGDSRRAALPQQGADLCTDVSSKSSTLDPAGGLDDNPAMGRAAGRAAIVLDAIVLDVAAGSGWPNGPRRSATPPDGDERKHAGHAESVADLTRRYEAAGREQ